MSRRSIERYIPKVISEIQEQLLEDVYVKDKNDEKKKIKVIGVAESFNGYISSFGASIMQSGVLPTVALFEKQEAKTKQKKYRLNSVILSVLKDVYKPSSKNTLLEYVVEHKEYEDILKKYILDISIAVKLSIRTFRLGDPKGKKDE